MARKYGDIPLRQVDTRTEAQRKADKNESMSCLVAFIIGVVLLVVMVWACGLFAMAS